jgi:UDP-3-O-[3-hydroxymyristoyl] glucosamine N-acyltransferase
LSQQQRVTLKDLAAEIGAELHGGPDAGTKLVTSCAGLEEAGEGQISFLSNPKYVKHLESTRATAVIVAPSVTLDGNHGPVLLKTKDPYYAYSLAMVRLHGHRRHPHQGIHPAAHVDPTATIGEGTVLYPGVYVGPRARVGRDCILYPNVVVYDDCIIGDRVTLHACCSIGHDGFGYATHKDADGVYRHHKIPQAGNVVIEDDVELGANCSIDRATMGSTVIGRGSKFSNNVAIGHGTQIGEHALFVAQVGIAGSTTIGHHVTIGGQSGVAGHLKVGSGVTIAAKSAVVSDLPDQMTVLGFPALPIGKARRSMAVYAQLPELLERIRKLEQAIEELADAGEEPGEA